MIRWMDIEKKARSLNIQNPNRYSKTDLIHTIQRAEGNTECFGAIKDNCPHTNCCWRRDCLK